jgi:hypothetical protein
MPVEENFRKRTLGKISAHLPSGTAPSRTAFLFSYFLLDIRIN